MMASSLLVVVVLVDLGRDVVDVLQDLLDDGFLAGLDGPVHVGQLDAGIRIDLGRNTLATAHVLELGITSQIMPYRAALSR